MGMLWIYFITNKISEVLTRPKLVNRSRTHPEACRRWEMVFIDGVMESTRDRVGGARKK